MKRADPNASDIEKLRRINSVLMDRVERSMDQQGNAFSLFQTAIGLEQQVRQRTDELTATLRRLEQSNRALNLAKEAAETANISKTRFLAAASHDVLQPLNAALLSISALAEIQSSERGVALARQVEQSLETMDELLRTLLDISKLDSGVMRPVPGEIALGAMFESLKADFGPLAAEKKLSIRFRPCDLFVRSDRTMLRRILQNIISNAIRYTRTGGVLVGARRRGDMVRIDVADTGIGIPPDQFEAVFEEFHRGALPAGFDVGYGGGLGLGLAIVQRMVTALRHQITFTSKEGRGTTFRVYVPLASAPRAAPEPIDTARIMRGRDALVDARVLLIENDSAVMEAMATLLSGWGCSVRMAAQTEEAIGLLGDAAWAPDIIVADQHLDNGDLGSVTIDHLRYYLRREVPALIVTADPSDGLVERTRKVDVELMRKPVKPAQLRALLAHMLGARKG
jgi:two-component system, sensor histidine kinase